MDPGISVWSHSYNSFSAAYDSVRCGCRQMITASSLTQRPWVLCASRALTPTIGFRNNGAELIHKWTQSSTREHCC